VAAKRVDFSYDTASQLNQITRYEDLAGTKLVATSSFVFDLSGRLTDLTHQQNATVFADYDWDYDAGNRLEQFVSSVDGTVDYNYDARDQLTAATYVGQASSLSSDESYTYDDNGNRVLANGATYQTDPNNRLVNDGTYTYLYDDEGNLTQRTKTSDGSYTVYTWDHRNRLTKITDKTSLNVVTKEVTYQYDVFNRRIAKAIDTPASGLQSQVYIYDGAHIAMTLSYNAVSEEYELTNRYLHGPAVDMILADEQISDPAQAGNTLWPLTDNLGSVRDLADYNAATDTTTIANHLVYDSFGNIASETNAAIDPSIHRSIDHIFGYTGRERDEESDFYYYRRRYYNPGTGRFASEDPIGFAAGDPNLNQYAGNNATGAVDPSGLVTEELAGASNVVDATGNPTGSTDCGYVGGGGEHYDDSSASNGSCGSAPQQGLNLRWDPSSGLPPTERQWEDVLEDIERQRREQQEEYYSQLNGQRNGYVSEARIGENVFHTYEQANRARFFRESRMGPIRTYLTWMIAPSNATGNQLNFDNYIGILGGFAPNAMPQGLRPGRTPVPDNRPSNYSGRYADGARAFRTNVPKDNHNVPTPDPTATGAHSRLQRDAVNPYRVYSATEFTKSGTPIKRTDFAGRQGDLLPHQHKYIPETRSFSKQKEPVRY
jgi:RHS repeat-associated protein